MKKYFLIVFVFSLLLTGCSKPESKLAGKWKNTKGLSVPYGGTWLTSGNWQSVEFMPNLQAIVTCSGHDNLLDFKIIDEGRMNIGGQLYGYAISDDVLTITSDGAETSFLKTVVATDANSIQIEKYDEAARKALAEKNALLKQIGK